jgi:hypothetical protein
MLLLALIVAQPPDTTRPPPDIELNVHATMREVRIRQRGETSLQVHATPDANSRVTIASPANARADGRNKVVDIHAEARIADPATNLPAPETATPDRR